jgi:hypothetical protein
MLTVVRLLPLVAIAFAAAADAPPPTGQSGVNASTGMVSDEEIRNAFSGKAACSPGELPVGVGPHEFRPNGDYVRRRDLASAHGRYEISNGRICVTLMESKAPDFCLAVLRRNDAWLFRLDQPDGGASRHEPTVVTPCPLP